MEYNRLQRLTLSLPRRQRQMGHDQLCAFHQMAKCLCHLYHHVLLLISPLLAYLWPQPWQWPLHHCNSSRLLVVHRSGFNIHQPPLMFSYALCMLVWPVFVLQFIISLMHPLYPLCYLTSLVNFSLVVCLVDSYIHRMVSNCILYNLTKQFQFLILLLFVLVFL